MKPKASTLEPSTGKTTETKPKMKQSKSSLKRQWKKERKQDWSCREQMSTKIMMQYQPVTSSSHIACVVNAKYAADQENIVMCGFTINPNDQ